MLLTTQNPQSKAAPWYSMVTSMVEGRPALALSLYGEIGWEVTAQEFIDDLAALGRIDAIELLIGSIGGSVWQGLDIYNALLNHPATKSVVITSLAASMASVIALAASPGQLRMMAQSMQMIHNPAGGAFGNQHDMQKASEMLAKVRELMIPAYMKRYNKSEPELIAMLDYETWLTAADCLANGLADEVIDQTVEISACLKPADLSRFDKTPKAFIDIVAGPKPASVEDTAALAAQAAERAAALEADPKLSAAADTPDGSIDMTPEEIKAAAKAARKVEAKRQTDIRLAFEPHQFTDRKEVLEACLADDECTIEMAQSRLLTALGAESKPVATSVVTVVDARDKFRAGVESAISMRIGRTPIDRSNEFVSMSLLEMCRQDATVRGQSLTGKDKYGIVAVALQPGSDFPGILENVATKEVLRGYDEKVEVYQTLARIGSLTDFKRANRSGLGHAPSLKANAELQEVESIVMGDRSQSIQLATFAGRAGLSRQAIINDDLNEFARLLTRLGSAAKRTVGDQFANVFIQHADGQSIDEGAARIFASARANTGTGGVPSTASFNQLRTLMALQSDVSGSAKNLNISPRFIYTPVAASGAAQVVATSQNEVGASTKNNTTPNIESGLWEIVSDSRLDAFSSTRYYALGDPNVNDTIEVAFLDGQDAPMIERVDTYDVLGVEWTVWIDCVAQALDFRAMAVNDGA